MSKNTLLVSEYQQLLRDLKSVVEGLLISQVANVWNVYGGLNRLHSVVENIFKHQFKVYTSTVSTFFKLFFLGYVNVIRVFCM